VEKYLHNHLNNRFIVNLVSPVLNTGLAARDYFLIRNSNRYTTRLVGNEPFGIEYDQLFEEVSRSFPIIGERTKDYLNWRYTQNPLSTFSRIEILENNTLKGYIIFHKSDNMIEIKDIFSHADAVLVETLLKKLLHHMRKQDANAVSVTLKENNPYIAHITKIGFKQRSESSDIYAHVNGQCQAAGDWLQGDNWFMTVGDRDV